MPRHKKKIALKLRLNPADSLKLDELAEKKWLNLSGNLPYFNNLKWLFFLNILVIILVFALKKFLPPQIPLYYGLAEGDEQLAAASFLTLPSIVSLAVVFLNTTLASVIKDDFTKRVLIATCFPISFFSLVTSVKIFILVAGI
jgi:hypothetical protein